MFRQRIYNLIHQYKKLNDHILIERDNHFWTLVIHDKGLANSQNYQNLEMAKQNMILTMCFFGW